MNLQAETLGPHPGETELVTQRGDSLITTEATRDLVDPQNGTGRGTQGKLTSRFGTDFSI